MRHSLFAESSFVMLQFLFSGCLFVCLFVCLFIYLWLLWVFVAACRLSLVMASRGYSSLQLQASHCGGFSCCGAWSLGAWASVVAAHGLSSCGPRSQLLRGMWDLPRAGLEPVSPTLAGGFLTIGPSGKSLFVYLILSCMSCLYILEINLCPLIRFQIFSPILSCIFILFVISFALQKILSFIRSHLFTFVFISISLGGGSQRILL